MLNDLSLAQEGHRLCEEEWIFQQDNAAIHNASMLEQENKTSWPHSVLSKPQFYGKFVGLQKLMKEVDCTQQFLNSKT